MDSGQYSLNVYYFVMMIRYTHMYKGLFHLVSNIELQTLWRAQITSMKKSVNFDTHLSVKVTR